MRKNIVCVTIIMLFLLTACGASAQPDNETPQPDNEISRAFFLENATQRERMEKLLYVTLSSDGTARLGTPPISSYALTYPVYYTLTDTELLILNNDYSNEYPIALFEVADDNTMIFIESSVLLYAEPGARYVYKPQWMAYDGSKITVYADSIPGIEVVRVAAGDVTRWSVTDKGEISRFAKWVENLVLERTTFTEGQYPGDNDDDGDIGYLFYTSFGAYMFEHGVYNGDIHYVYIGNDWYNIQNPSDPPLAES